MLRNYYQVLGVDEKASEADIKSAYRKLARIWHPDVNNSPKAVVKFQEIQEAHQTLSSPSLREAYDKALTAPNFESDPKQQHATQGRTTYKNDYDHSHRYRFTTYWSQFPTNYEGNSKAAKGVCFITLLFSFTFIVDLFVHQTLDETTVIAVQNKSQLTGRSDDMDRYIIQTNRFTFEKKMKQPLQKGMVLELRKSGIYGFISFKSPEMERFLSLNEISNVALIGGILILFVSLIGLSPWPSAEATFNAAIISGFFGFCLFLFVVFI